MVAPPPKKTGMSLYADLLNADKAQSGTTIAGAPVKYDIIKKLDADEDGVAKRKDGTFT